MEAASGSRAMTGGREEPSTLEPLCRRPALCMQALICCFALTPHIDGTVTHHCTTSLLKCLPYFPRRCSMMNSPISRKKSVTTPVKLREEEGPRLEKALSHLDQWLLQDGAWTWWQKLPTFTTLGTESSDSDPFIPLLSRWKAGRSCENQMRAGHSPCLFQGRLATRSSSTANSRYLWLTTAICSREQRLFCSNICHNILILFFKIAKFWKQIVAFGI